MNIAIIPARGGSKRIPRKNIKLFYGKPMIAWSIEAALKSECFDRVIVSTDDNEIADISKEWGADTPFIRPESLSDDYTGTGAVVKHSIEWLQSKGDNVGYVCCIYATAPFISASDLKKGEALIKQNTNDFVFAATTFPFPIQRAIKLDDAGRVSMFQPEHFLTRSQDLTEAWHDVGQFYWGTASAWAENLPIFKAQSSIVEIPRFRAQDIDTEDDWLRAEVMYQILEKQGAIV
ncbi:pseudaminic acid cytidylyltransferase [Endozoicomonas sp. ONNA2]|uniref:pseudaminic acid cytidylyltransferase n=1 Tax=Endozoicomonas sp. ONNA2 TaxID=2828741 RepID=UPI0021477BC6|nr:pseudaminic acid cytidylyltransferase [Endozoicomonas sp. ONNA2]